MVSLITRHDEIDRPARFERGEHGSDEIRHYFYTQNWQCVEERATADDSDVPAPEDLDADMQYVWGLRYIDDLILRDRDTSTPKNGTLNERLYAMQDPNWNVVALAESDGDVVERYLYSAYGDPVVLNADFAEDSDGTDYAWEFRFTGRRTDLETELMYYRHRMYHPGLGRFVSRDPIGYDAGDSNLHCYVGNTPTKSCDAWGLLMDDLGPVIAGTRWKGKLFCVPVPFVPWLSFCLVYDVSVNLTYCECKRACIILHGTIEAGIFGTGTVGGHRPPWPPRVKPWPGGAPFAGIRVPWPVPNFPFIHGATIKCPPEGLSMAGCITASIGIGGWFGGATVGCQWCHYKSVGWVTKCGSNIGAGTGISGGFGITYTACANAPMPQLL